MGGKNESINKFCLTCEFQKDINNKIIDNHYIIDGYLYAFKKELMNEKISLLFVNRKNCGTLLTLNKNELYKKLEGKIQSCKYILNKIYKSNGFNEIKKETKEVQSESDLIKAAKTIIIQKKEKSFS